MSQIPWDVFRIIEDGNYAITTLIDTVFYDDGCNAWYVYTGLVNHDGYPSDIIVRNNKMHSELHGRSLEDYAYDEEIDVDTVEEMYEHPVEQL